MEHSKYTRRTGYNLFCSVMRDDAKVALDNTRIPYKHSHVNRELAAMWKLLSLEERTHWKLHARTSS